MGQTDFMGHALQLDSAARIKFVSQINAINAGVIATADREHGPESAFINLAVMPDLAIVFETLISSRKYRNLQRDPRAALVIDGGGKTTFQIEGLVDEPTDVLRDDVIAAYYKACAQNLSHRDWPGLTYMRLRPRWLRYSDYGMPWKVEEYFLSP